MANEINTNKVQQEELEKSTKEKQTVENAEKTDNDTAVAQQTEEGKKKPENLFEMLMELLKKIHDYFGRGSIGKQIEDLQKAVAELSENQEELALETAGFIYNSLKEFASEKEFSKLTDEDLIKKGEEIKLKQEEIEKGMKNRCVKYKGSFAEELKKQSIKDFGLYTNQKTGELFLLDTTDMSNITAYTVTVEKANENDKEGKLIFHSPRVVTASEFADGEKYYQAKTSSDEEEEIEKLFKTTIEESVKIQFDLDKARLLALNEEAKLHIMIVEARNLIKESEKVQLDFENQVMVLYDEDTDTTVRIRFEDNRLIFEGCKGKDIANLEEITSAVYGEDEKTIKSFGLNISPEYAKIFASDEMRKGLIFIDNGIGKEIEIATAEWDMGKPISEEGLIKVGETRNILEEFALGHNCIFEEKKTENKVVHRISEPVHQIMEANKLKAEIKYTHDGYVSLIRTEKNKYNLLHGIPDIEEEFVKKMVDTLDENSLLRGSYENAMKKFNKTVKGNKEGDER